MILFECCPPFQWKASLNRDAMAGGWRFMWAWFAVGYVPFDFNSYVEGLARAGAELYHSDEFAAGTFNEGIEASAERIKELYNFGGISDLQWPQVEILITAIRVLKK